MFGRNLLLALGWLSIGWIPGSASALEIAGSTTAHFSWAPSSGPVVGYVVYVSRNGAPFGAAPDLYVTTTAADVRGAPGDSIVLGVAALGVSWPPGPISVLSYPVKFATKASAPAVSVSDTILFLPATPGMAAPSADVMVVNSGGGTLDFTVATSAPWLQATPSTGSSTTAEVPVHLSVSTAALTSGSNLAYVTIRAAGVALPTYLLVSASLLDPVPVFALSQDRVSVPILPGQASPQIDLTVTSTVPSESYQLATDVDWIRLESDGGTLHGFADPISFSLDPTGLSRSTHSGHLYVIPFDLRALTFMTDVTLTVVDPSAPRRLQTDLNADGREDLVWRDPVTGNVQLWLMSGALQVGSALLAGPAPAADWSVAAVGDLDGDGRADLVWQNARTGAALVWFMNGLVRTRSAALPTPPNVGLQIVAACDVDGDGRADLVQQQLATGIVSIWLMNGSLPTGLIVPDRAGEAVASVIGCGDFDATGTADLVWRTATGGTYLWLSSGATPGEVIPIDAPPEAGWTIAGIGDLGGNGKSDLVWRNDALRETTLWSFESPTVYDASTLPTMLQPGWKLVGIADFDGDHNSDLLWRNTATGQSTIWMMQGSRVRQGGNLIAPPPASWSVRP